MPNTYHSELVERPGGLNVLQSLLQLRNFLIYDALGLLRILHGRGLKFTDGFEGLVDVVGLWRELLVRLFNLCNDVLVLQDASVVREVDLLRCILKRGDLAARIFVALLEGLELGGSRALETEGRG